MRFSGYQNVPGAPGQVAYPGMNPMMMAGNPSFDINRGAGAIGGMAPMGNAGSMTMPMTQMPMGFQNKTVS